MPFFDCTYCTSKDHAIPCNGKPLAWVTGAKFILSGTAHAELNCAGGARSMFMTPPSQTLMGDPSPRQTSISKNSDCAIKSERGALGRGSDPP